MPGQSKELRVLYVGDASGVTRTLAQIEGAHRTLGARLEAIGRRFQTVGRTLTRSLTLPIVGAGIAATKLALDYDTAFTRISAVSNAAAEDVERWRGQVLELAEATGRSPQELAEALFFLASAGLETSQVMDALEASSQAAAVGLGETQEIARLTANVLNAYAKSGLTATDAVDTLVAAVKAGTAEPEEFAGALGRILPIASRAGVEFADVTASLAALSNIGLDVNEGVTAMRGLLQALVAPGSAAAEALKDVGISADQMRRVISEEGILGALRLLEERTKGDIDVLREIIPNVRSLTGELGLTGENAKTVAGIFAQVSDSAGALGDAMRETAESPAFRLQQNLQRLRTAGIELGNQLIPVATQIADVVGDIAEAFSRLSPEQQRNIIRWAAIAAAAGPVLRVFGGILRLSGGLIRAVRGLGTALGIGAGALGAFSAGLAVMAAGFIQMELDARRNEEAIERLTTKLANGQDALEDLARTLDEQNIPAWARAKIETEIVAEAQERAAETIRDTVRAAFQSRDAFEEWGQSLIQASNLTLKQRTRLAALLEGLEKFDIELTDSQRFTVDAYIATGNYNGALQVLQGLLRPVTRGLQNMLTPQEALAEATADHAQQVIGLVGGLREYRRLTNPHSEFLRGLQNLLSYEQRLAEATADHAQQQRALNDAIQAGTRGGRGRDRGNGNGQGAISPQQLERPVVTVDRRSLARTLDHEARGRGR